MNGEPHRSAVREYGAEGHWQEATPLPFYGIRKRCECGRAFWTEGAYRRHWRTENRKALAEALAACGAH